MRSYGGLATSAMPWLGLSRTRPRYRLQVWNGSGPRHKSAGLGDAMMLEKHVLSITQIYCEWSF